MSIPAIPGTPTSTTAAPCLSSRSLLLSSRIRQQVWYVRQHLHPEVVPAAGLDLDGQQPEQRPPVHVLVEVVVVLQGVTYFLLHSSSNVL